MPEALRGPVLALVLLCALTSHATEPPPAATLVEMTEDDVLPASYEEVQSTSESTSDGDLTVSVNQTVASPPRGYLPLEVVLRVATPVLSWNIDARLSWFLCSEHSLVSRIDCRQAVRKIISWHRVPASFPIQILN